jgi:hypothetical protein
MKELFEEIKELANKYCLVKLLVRIEKGDDGYYFADLKEDSFISFCGLFPSEMIKEAFDNLEIKVDKEGCYEIDALLSLQHDEDSYMNIEYIEYAFFCTLEEDDEQQKLANEYHETIVDNFFNNRS